MKSKPTNIYHSSPVRFGVDTTNYLQLEVGSTGICYLKSGVTASGLQVGITGSKVGFLGAAPAARVAHKADLAVDYTDDASAKDLDTDARRVAAMNATNTKINEILSVLETFGFLATS